MSVVGFDIGCQKSTIAVAKGGGIEIVLNEESDRFTPSCISFGERLRFVGYQAKQHMNTHPQTSVFNMKRMIGRHLSDPFVQKEKGLLGCQLVEGANGEAAARLNYMNEDHDYTMTQLTAMLLVKLKSAVEKSTGIKAMKDCVISCPSYYSDFERQCMLNAAGIAGLNCLKLLNETTAVALCYGIFRTDFPADAPVDTNGGASAYVGKSKIVAFAEVGHAAAQFSLVAFNAGKLRVLASVYDTDLGGRYFDQRLSNHFIEEFKKKYKFDVNTKRRAQMRLMTECERVKKLMSANSSPIPLNIDCLMEDRDVTSTIKRADFEEMCTDLLQRVVLLAQKLLSQAGLKASDVDDVEIIGGATRMPAIRERIKTIFGREPSTTINAEEAVSRGCAIQCAVLSPNFRVREFAVADYLQYPITIEWDKTAENEENVMDLFTRSDKLPASKMLTLNKSQPFSVSARYTNPDEIPHPCKALGRYTIKDIPANSNKLKLKVRVNKHGIFQLADATAYERYIETVEEPVQTPPAANGAEGEKAEPMDQSASNEENSKDVPETNGAANDVEMKAEAPESANLDGVETAPATEKKEKVKVRAHDLPFEWQNVPGLLTEAALRDFIECENGIQSQNKQERDRIDSKNALEEYGLSINRQLSEELKPFATAEEAKKLSSMCEASDMWLYDEGENQARSVYQERLDVLKKVGDPIRRRHYEQQHRQPAFDQLARALMHYRKIVDAYKAKDEKFAHLDAKEMERVEKTVLEKQAWFDERQGKQMSLKPFQDPAVLADQILTEANFVAKTCEPIVTRPKPAPKPPTPPPAEDGSKKKKEPEAAAAANGADAAAKTADATNAEASNGMELD